MFLELEVPKYPSVERYVCWNVSWPASADNLVKTDFLFRQNFTPVTVVHHCIRRQCFILLPNVWVVFKIYFAILHKIVARNNVQQSIRLNKQKEKEKVFVLLHYIRLVMLHIRVICFEHMAAWKRCCDMRKVCGNIFEDRKRR